MVGKLYINSMLCCIQSLLLNFIRIKAIIFVLNRSQCW